MLRFLQPPRFTDAESNVTEYGYDGHGRHGWTRYPAAAKGAGQSNWADWEGYSYDAGGNIVSRRLRDGQTIGYAGSGDTKIPGTQYLIDGAGSPA